MDLRAFFATFVAGVFIALCAFYIATRGPIASSAGWTAEGLVTVILAATTVVLAALGIAVALVAIWGYDRIKDAAIKESTTKAIAAAVTAAVEKAKETAEVTAAREVAARMQSGTASASREFADAFAREGEQ
jgi:hypothetical protein